jgi:hypothetical protein
MHTDETMWSSKSCMRAMAIKNVPKLKGDELYEQL